MAIAIRPPPRKLLSSPTSTSSTTSSSPLSPTTNRNLLTLLSRLAHSLRSGTSSSAPAPPTPAPWPEFPFPLIHTTGAHHSPPIPEAHFCIRNAQIMAQTHNTIFRALNAIHAQASSCSPHISSSPTTGCHAFAVSESQQRRRRNNILDLLHFVLVTCAFITNHHHAEESAFFPLIEEYCERPGLMEVNVVQHVALERDLEGLRAYVEGLLGGDAEGTEGWERYDAEELRARVEGLAGSLGTHMREEIGCILGLHEWVPSSVLEGIYARMHAVAASGMDKWKAGPFVFFCQDASFLLDGEAIPFPEVPVPYIVPFIIDQVVSRRHAGVWRFCPSSAYGRPRPCTGRPLEESQSSLSLLFLLGQGSRLRALIGWLMIVFLAWEFGAYVRAIY